MNLYFFFVNFWYNLKTQIVYTAENNENLTLKNCYLVSYAFVNLNLLKNKHIQHFDWQSNHKKKRNVELV